MKKAVIKKLQEVAAGLPEITRTVQVPKTAKGKDLPAVLTKAGVGGGGKPIDPEKEYPYWDWEQQPVNHLNNLKAAYKRGGDGLVKQYATNVRETHLKQQAKLREARHDDPVATNIINRTEV